LTSRQKARDFLFASSLFDSHRAPMNQISEAPHVMIFMTERNGGIAKNVVWSKSFASAQVCEGAVGTWHAHINLWKPSYREVKDMSKQTMKVKPRETGHVIAIPRSEWEQFLRSFSRRHHRWLVRIETQDLQTGEHVTSPETPLESVELDLEDPKNSRINVVVAMDNKRIKHILFRPSRLILYRSPEGADEAIHIESVNTRTTVRFRVAILPELVDEMV
jgi:Family of unknown function (DUF5335)